MKNYFLPLFMFLLLMLQENLIGQAQTTIEMDSDSNNPQISIMETESGDFVRFWFQHALAPNNKWAMNARTQNGTTSNDGQLLQPFVLAFNGVQKLGLSSDGKVRINNQYILPSMDGAADQILSTDGAGISSWTDRDPKYWDEVPLGILHNGLVTINPTSPGTFDEPAFTTQVNRANQEPIVSLRNTNGVGDATVFMNASAEYWSYGVDSDLNAFKINHVGNGINTTLDDGNKRFAILGDSGFIGFGTDAPSAELDLAAQGADIRFSDGDDSAVEWFDNGTKIAHLEYSANNLELKNAEISGDLVLDAVDEVIIRNNGSEVMNMSNNEVTIDNVLRLEPRVVAPSCVNGRIYYSATLDKIRVCAGGIWKTLQFE